LKEIVEEKMRRKETLRIYNSTKEALRIIGDLARDALSDASSASREPPSPREPRQTSQAPDGNNTSHQPSSSVETAATPYRPQSVSNGNISGYLLKWTNYFKGYQKRWIVLNNDLLSYYRYF
jgi:hypothetical protein